ncbi:MAG TPA: DUF2975 domain-containing protein [bacterium]|nr:DUF2975 domain-containing protein [bacterium]
MNATVIAPTTTNSRLKRIQKVSRIFRYFVLANLVFNAGFWLLFLPRWSSGRFTITVRGVLMFITEPLLFYWFWKLAQLFRLYERGQIFAAETIRCIKVLGMVCIIGWMALLALRFTPRPDFVVHNPPAGVKVMTETRSETRLFRMGFFSFDFGTGIDFGPLFVGASVVLAAWIMDEGRKIQEEQELTV